MGEREVYKELTTFSQIRNRECNECLREISAIYFQEENIVAVKTQADCGISGLPDKKEMY